MSIICFGDVEWPDWFRIVSKCFYDHKFNSKILTWWEIQLKNHIWQGENSFSFRCIVPHISKIIEQMIISELVLLFSRFRRIFLQLTWSPYVFWRSHFASFQYVLCIAFFKLRTKHATILECSTTQFPEYNLENKGT